MTDLNPLGTLVSTDEFASCCSGEVGGEIIHAHLNSITEAVRHRYGALAKTAADRALSSDKASDTFYTEEQRNGVTDETAGASAGCGKTVGIADAKPGETVLDLGSGGGIDCFLAAREVGHTGHVIGIDMTPEMLTLARDNADKLRTNNVVFKLGHIESIPQSDNSVDLVISNCVIALSEKKKRVFSEIFRILKPGGRFVISDVVTEKPLPGDVRKSAAEWVDCVGGAAVMSEYIEMIADAGFLDVEVLEKQTRSSGAEAWRDLLINLTVRAFKKV